jgi:hypothetical protein
MMLSKKRKPTLNALRWRLTLAITWLIPLLVLLILLPLAFGAALSAPTPSGWKQQPASPDLILDHAPDELPTVFTREESAQNNGPLSSALGPSLSGASLVIVVDKQGYYSV